MSDDIRLDLLRDAICRSDLDAAGDGAFRRKRDVVFQRFTLDRDYQYRIIAE